MKVRRFVVLKIRYSRDVASAVVLDLATAAGGPRASRGRPALLSNHAKDILNNLYSNIGDAGYEVYCTSNSSLIFLRHLVM